MEEQKFRQAIFVGGVFSYWHYWGFIKEEHGNLTFVAPEMGLSSIKKAYKNSYQNTSLKDTDGVDIYGGDYIKWQVQRGTFIVSEVIFTRGEFCVRSEGLLWGCGDCCSEDGQLGDVKIIGNIVETPELVEGALTDA